MEKVCAFNCINNNNGICTLNNHFYSLCKCEDNGSDSDIKTCKVNTTPVTLNPPDEPKAAIKFQPKYDLYDEVYFKDYVNEDGVSSKFVLLA